MTEHMEDVDRDKLFEDYVVITITQVKNPEDSEDWECDLKAGWFRKSSFSHSVTGRFGKNKITGEWVATIMSWRVDGSPVPP